ncbi:MAG: hypothetical protein DPW09_18875 [Anaerolineae bacterium]|nr:hypothetical protein [Anaerolineales bacterium]MCQ3975505.1 hypothetical protein [Anaerolineae bacterium]
MLTGFDWLRRSRTGAELLATLEYLAVTPDLFAETEVGPPLSALNGPCLRCWLYTRMAEAKAEALYCRPCRAVINRARKLGMASRRTILIWGFTNRLPRQLRERQGFYAGNVRGSYVYDERHFLLAMQPQQLKPWLQELVLYHGADLKGLLQILPTIGAGEETGMGDILTRVIHREADFSMDRLRVRFFAEAYQVIRLHARDLEGILTFEVADFLSLLEMAAVFRTLLRPEEQQALKQILEIDTPGEAQFYWGRFLGLVNQEVKDMLNAWQIRHWPKSRVSLLFELVDYVGFYQAN